MKTSFLPLFLALGLLLPPPVQADVPERTDTSLLNTTEDRESAYRHRSFCAYLPLRVINERLQVGNYSVFENPTGIYFREGEKAVITLTGSPRQPISLIVHDFGHSGGHAVYNLTPGRNELTMTTSGLAYVDYRDTNPATAAPVQVDIGGGTVNGIFTANDTDAIWQQVLDGTTCGLLDIVGERCQLVYDVEGLRKGCPTEGREMLELYDRIIGMEQEMLGWDQFKCHPGNHIMGRVQWHGYMHADQLGAAFVYTAIPDFSNPEKIQGQSWAIAHEFGHINQTRPGMLWAGTSEVTNNLFSAWVNYRLNPADLRLEHEVCPSTSGLVLRGGRFDCYINNAVVRRQLWLFQGGPDSGLNSPPGERTGDPFVAVCPMWQLQLYNAVARDSGNFYPRIFRKVRRQNDKELTHGEMQVNFFLNACESAHLDFSEFFVTTGMLAPMNRMVEDYEPHMVTITPEMCQAALEKAAKYPKPDSSVIHYINGNNVSIYRKRLPVQVAPNFRLDPGKGVVDISAEKCRNAVAYEAVDGDGAILRIALLGLGHEDNSTTKLVCPEGTAGIRAVQWDGQRVDLWKKEKP